MATRWPIVVGLAAVGGGLVWLWTREASPPAPATSQVAATTPEIAPVERTPEPVPPVAPPVPNKPLLPNDRLRPTLPEQVPPAELFGQEHRDDSWAVATEAEIEKRLENLRGGALQAAECRQTECRIEITGNTHGVSRAMADLPTKHGLAGFASSMLLTAPEQRADGTLVLRAYLTFER